jgi:hypothetical protein
MATKGLSKETLDFTQRIQRAFPYNLRGSVLEFYQKMPEEILQDMLRATFSRMPHADSELLCFKGYVKVFADNRTMNLHDAFKRSENRQEKMHRLSVHDGMQKLIKLAPRSSHEVPDTILGYGALKCDATDEQVEAEFGGLRTIGVPLCIVAQLYKQQASIAGMLNYQNGAVMEPLRNHYLYAQAHGVKSRISLYVATDDWWTIDATAFGSGGVMKAGTWIFWRYPVQQ